MFRTIADFEQAWLGERERTLKVFQALTDASLAQSVAPGSRTLGRIAWHIVQTLGEMGRHAGLDVRAANEHSPQPALAPAFADAYEAGSKALLTAVTDAWQDADLPGEIDMYGEKWTRGATLAGIIAHEAHHRGQMTVLMRQAGLTVPGTYGPAREEWSAYGMPTQD